MSAELQQRPQARILDVTQAEYFADPCEVPSLSQSIGHVLISKSPLHAWTRHPRLGGMKEDEDEDDELDTVATARGKLIHSLVLGKGSDICVIDADAFRSNAAKEERDEAIARGQLPVLAKKYEAAVKIADILKSNIEACGIKLSGASEVAIEWREQGEYGQVLCRCLMDHLILADGVVIDFKTIRSAHPVTCGRHMIEYGYDIQHAAYTSAISKLRPDLRGRTDFIFLFAELKPPYSVLPARPDGMARECGEMRWSRAVHTWERCMRTNRWPGYADNIVSLSAPQYLINREMEQDNV